MEQTRTKQAMTKASPGAAAALKQIRETAQACMQCGTCSASCPNAESMDFTPRRMWRLAQFGMWDDIFNSKTFWYCSTCYTCTLRCPRGLPLTETIGALKRLAAGQEVHRKNSAFYRVFVDNVRKNGRVHETQLMTTYFRTMRDPRLPLRFMPLGLKLFKKGKVHLGGSKMGKGKLNALYEKIREMEAGS